MSRRSNGEGSIYTRADGRWHVRWYDPDGRRRSAYTRTREEASQRLRGALAHVDAGVPSIESGECFETVAEQWRINAAMSPLAAVSGMTPPTQDRLWRWTCRLMAQSRRGMVTTTESVVSVPVAVAHQA